MSLRFLVLRWAAPVFAVVALVGALPPTAAADPVQEAAGVCDPIDPALCLLPFPNDLFTTPDESMDTGRRVDLNILAMPRNVAGVPINPIEWNRNDGFSPGSLIVTKVPGLDTPEALSQTDPVTLRDLSRYSEADAPVVVLNAETGERHPIWAEIDMGAEEPADRTFLIRPATNFEEGTRYIVALRDMRDASGNVIEASDAFKSYRDAAPQNCGGGQGGGGKGHGNGGNGNGKGKGDENGKGHDKNKDKNDEEPGDHCGGDPSGTPEERAEHFQSIFHTLEDAGIARDDLFLAWDFTVASERNLSERMLHIRDDAFAQLGDTDLADLEVDGAAPAFTISTVTENPEPEIMRRVEGTVRVPCYLDKPGCPTGSQYFYTSPTETVPTQIPGNFYDAKFICNIPNSVSDRGPARPSLYGHGLLGSADEVNSGKLYRLGSNHNIMFCGVDWIGMSTEDLPNAASLLVDLGRFATLADRMQQGFLDFLYIGRAMIHPDGFSSDPAFQDVGDPTIDTSRLYYDGGSQGGIAGGGLTAVAPDFTRAALGVPAMNYSTLLSRSIDFDSYLVVLDQGYPNKLERQLLYSLIQMLWDRGEANGYAHHMTDDPLPNTPPHQVLLHMAFGDHQVTNWATLVEARTIGASVRIPQLDPGRDPTADMFWGIPEITSYPHRGSALVAWDVGPLRDGGDKGTTPPPIENVPNREGVDPHGPDASETVEGQLQIAQFLMPEGVVIPVCGDAPCYLDGWTGPPAT